MKALFSDEKSNPVRCCDHHHSAIHELVHMIASENDWTVIRNVFPPENFHGGEENRQDGVEKHLQREINEFLRVRCDDQDKGKQKRCQCILGIDSESMAKDLDRTEDLLVVPSD